MGRCACAGRNARRRRRSIRDTPGLPTAVKIVLFRRLLRGRSDVHPVRWESKASDCAEPSAKGFAVRPGGHELGDLSVPRCHGWMTITTSRLPDPWRWLNPTRSRLCRPRMLA